MSEAPSKSGAPPMNDFKKIIVDFTKDILTTFPEYKTKLNIHLQTLLESEDETQTSASLTRPKVSCGPPKQPAQDGEAGSIQPACKKISESVKPSIFKLNRSL